jgi:diacylglycerol kinase family enzyme
VVERVAFVVNPVSGGGGGYEDFVRAAEVLGKRGVHVASFATDPDEGGRPAAEEALAAGYDEIWVIGGDGTIRDCLRPIVEADAILGPLPGGTANYFARAIGPHPDDVGARAEWMADQPIERVDLGECEGELFSVHVGVGFEAVAAEKTQDNKSGLGSLAYVVAGYQALGEVEPQAARLTCGDEVVYEGEMLSALFSNLPFETLVNAARGVVGDPIDGLLTARVVKEAPGWQMLIRWLNDEVGAPPPQTVVAHSGAEYRLETEHESDVHVDGQMIGRHRTLSMRCLPRVLQVRGVQFGRHE